MFSCLFRYSRLGKFGKVLDCYLKLGRDDVFQLIDAHNLYNDILDRIVPLLEYETKTGRNKDMILTVLVQQTNKFPVNSIIFLLLLEIFMCSRYYKLCMKCDVFHFVASASR